MQSPPGLELEMTFAARIEGPLGPSIGSLRRLTCADHARLNTSRAEAGY